MVENMRFLNRLDQNVLEYLIMNKISSIYSKMGGKEGENNWIVVKLRDLPGSWQGCGCRRVGRCGDGGRKDKGIHKDWEGKFGIPASRPRSEGLPGH